MVGRPLNSALAALSLALLSWEPLISPGLLEPHEACNPKERVNHDHL